jgi:hypothetical protein
MPELGGKGKRLKEPLSATHPELAAEWHPTKNESLTSNDVTYGSGRKVWWLCAKGHTWSATVTNRAKGRGWPWRDAVMRVSRSRSSATWRLAVA